MIRIKAHSHHQAIHDYAINLYSPHNILLIQDDSANYPGLLYNISPMVNRGTQAVHKFNNDCYFAAVWTGSFIWIFGQNLGCKVWKMKITFIKMKNLKICKKYRTNDNILTLVIGSSDKVTAYVKRLDKGSVEFD